MTSDRTKDELKQVADHAKGALLATLRAARSALDAAIDRIDAEEKAADTAAGTAEGAPAQADGGERPPSGEPAA